MAIRTLEPRVDDRLLNVEELRAAVREIGRQRYHHQHPFHLLMHEGRLTRGQLQAWALNRYYYQSRIPIKDAIVISRSDDPVFRRAWRKRIASHAYRQGVAHARAAVIHLAVAIPRAVARTTAPTAQATAPQFFMSSRGVPSMTRLLSRMRSESRTSPTR